MKEAIKVLEEKRNKIEGVLTPFNKENNSDAYKKSLKEYKQIIKAIEILKSNNF
jgi:hypothetical protein